MSRFDGRLRGEKSSRCYVCGPDNPYGLQVAFERDGERGSRAIYRAREEHEGWKGILHGGVTFCLMDEALGWCLFYQGIGAVTTKIETRFVKPVPIDSEVIVRAWVVRNRKRLYEAHAEVCMNNAEMMVLAEADAVMVAMSTDEESTLNMEVMEVR